MLVKYNMIINIKNSTLCQRSSNVDKHKSGQIPFSTKKINVETEIMNLDDQRHFNIHAN